MGVTEHNDVVPLTFNDVQDEHGHDVLVARDRNQMTPEERRRSRENIQRLVEQLRASARPIRPLTDG